MNRLLTVLVPALALISCALSCKSPQETPKGAPAAPPAPPVTRPAPPAAEPAPNLALLEVAREPRRKESARYGAMTQDHLLLVARCGGDFKVPVMLGVLDLPYDNARGLVAVAEVSAEKALSQHAAPEGCRFVEASFWSRDEQGKGDFAVRYPVKVTGATSVWWVPDDGEPRRSAADQVPGRVFVDRLLRVASFQAEVAEDLEAALGLVEAARLLDPKNPRTIEVWAEIATEHDPQAAVTALRRFIEENGTTADLDATLAAALLRLEPPEAQAEAEALLHGVLEREPKHLKALATHAERRRAQGDAAGAIAAYRKLFEAHPSDATARYNLATLLLDRNEKEEALEQLDRFLETFPEDPDALFLRARLRLGKGDREGAARDLLTLRRVAPETPEVRALADEIGGE